MVGSFMLFSAIANAVGAPIAGVLLDLDGLLGLKGWQCVFMVTGIPAVVIGFISLVYLDDRPETAHFLHPEEKDWLRQTLAAEDRAMHKTSHENPFAIFCHPSFQILHPPSSPFNSILERVVRAFA
jgi:sugar phosphate permease